MKITQRDKMLLLLLVALLVVAVVIVLPNVGVLACNERVDAVKSKTDSLESSLNARLNELYEMGVDSGVAENSYAAMNALEDKILELQTEAALLAGSIMAYAKPFAVDENWVDGLEYRYGVKSDEYEKIVDYSPIADVDASDNGNTIDVTLEGEENMISLPIAKRDIRFTVTETADCTYAAEFSMDAYGIEDLGAVLLFLQHITSKGSMLIDEVNYFTKENNIYSVSFTLLMPPVDSQISSYATIVAEKLRQRAEEEAGEAD